MAWSSPEARRAHYEKNREGYAQRAKTARAARLAKDPDYENRLARKRRERDRESYNTYHRKYRKRSDAPSIADKKAKTSNPEKRRARYLLDYAVQKGEVIRPDICPVCQQSAKCDAHHPDHSEPLKVDWMCRSCHSKLDVSYGIGKNRRKFVPNE